MDQQACATVFNDSPVALSNVTLEHNYEEIRETHTWDTVPPGGAASPPLTVSYRTGFGEFGSDHWCLKYTLPDGSVWRLDDRDVTLHAGDSGKTQRFTVRSSVLTDFSGGSQQMIWRHNGYDYSAWSAVQLRNDFPVAARAVLEHTCETATQRARFPVLPPGATTTEPLIVHFSPGFFSSADYWTLSITLDIPPYDDAPEQGYGEFRNATSEYACGLGNSDNGQTRTFAVDGRGLTFSVGAGTFIDEWETWNGYNKLAFLTVRNDFTEALSTLRLSHQYDGDTVWHQTRALVPPGGTTSPMAVEYFTGATHPGLDWWHVQLYFVNGDWCENSAASKECMLRDKDAKAMMQFAVSPDRFTLDLPSGGCSDTMTAKKKYAPSAGRDPHRPYDENAFLGSHNAFCTMSNGFRYYSQQASSLEVQLAKGATTLLLDLWYDDDVDDVCLKHENWGPPWFFDHVLLSDALAVVRRFLQLQSRDPVTLVFEDRTDGRHDLIKRAFETSKTWSMVFNPDRDLVNGHWPTLAELFSRGTPLVVFTSSGSSPHFAYQWRCMSENVWGNASVDPHTWLTPRPESGPLNQKALCALNHFASFALPEESQVQNTVDRLELHFEACRTATGRYPTYLNLDFWEIPSDDIMPGPNYHGGALEALRRLNQKLHGAVGVSTRRSGNGSALPTGDENGRSA
ncbi:hypothetical protein ACFV1L_30300 [Kitasatospora sp. NPDC059646]|uniref:hypothetical protein n=1 Tax=Kitasatospora sp. NPDC059646 TaxID=3346893 RepID=UPI003696412B